jgi:hypothetical protein
MHDFLWLLNKCDEAELLELRDAIEAKILVNNKVSALAKSGETSSIIGRYTFDCTDFELILDPFKVAFAKWYGRKINPDIKIEEYVLKVNASSLSFLKDTAISIYMFSSQPNKYCLMAGGYYSVTIAKVSENYLLEEYTQQYQNRTKTD